MTGAVSGPLEGVRVLDLTRLLPGGYASALLGDLGAEVIKIEPPHTSEYSLWKDSTLGTVDISGQAWVMDRNKRSVALDLKAEGGLTAFNALVRTADIVLEGFRPGVVKRLKVSYEDLSAQNPALVYCSLSGYGQSGPEINSPGHDINYIGRAGLLSITGTIDQPILPGVQIADLGGGGLTALVGVLAALYRARTGGEGDYVDVSMTDGAFAWLCTQMGRYFATGEVPERGKTMLGGSLPCYNVFRCADGEWLTVGALEEKFFWNLCEAVGRADLVGTRTESQALPLWREIFSSRPRAEWLELFEGRDVCVGPVNDFPAALADPQLQNREMTVIQEDGEGSCYPQVACPIKLRNNPATLRSSTPRVGADTRALLTQAGMSAAEIDDLIATGSAAG